VKKLLALLGIALLGCVAWIAAGPDQESDVSVRRDVPAAIGAPAPAPATLTSASVPELSGEPLDAPPSEVEPEPPVPAAVIAPIATETAPPPVIANETPSMRDPDAPRAMIVPVAGVTRSALRDMFNETRGKGRHEAIDILAPTGTPVIATDDGEVKKLFTSKPGGLTVYQFDPDQRFCYYYAHLDRYAPRLDPQHQRHRPVRRGGRDLAAEAQRRPVEHPPAVAAARAGFDRLCFSRTRSAFAVASRSAR
jgi:hypothetical protein